MVDTLIAGHRTAAEDAVFAAVKHTASIAGVISVGIRMAERRDEYFIFRNLADDFILYRVHITTRIAAIVSQKSVVNTVCLIAIGTVNVRTASWAIFGWVAVSFIAGAAVIAKVAICTKAFCHAVAVGAGILFIVIALSTIYASAAI